MVLIHSTPRPSSYIHKMYHIIKSDSISMQQFQHLAVHHSVGSSNDCVTAANICTHY